MPPFRFHLANSLGFALACAALLADPTVSAQQPASPPSAPPAAPQQPASVPSQVQPSGPDKPVPKALTTPSPSAPVTPLVLSSAEQSTNAPSVSEQNVRQQLQGKTFYLRSGLLDNELHFDEQGHLRDTSPKASHTLSLVEIQRVRLQKHRLEIQAVRYGLHFLGASPTEDQSAAVDRVQLTAKKKPLLITIDREDVIKPRKEKEKHEKLRGPQPAAGSHQPPATAAQAPPATSDIDDSRGHVETTSPAHANRALAHALDAIFAASIDERMIATLPDYWKFYYKSVGEHRDWKPSDAGILRQSDVDQKARLVTVVDPPSNEFAQNNGVAGVAMYHVVLGADGKPQQIAIGRPIGFGLDENAVKAIHDAKFQPAIKGGQPVSVLLDLTVQFRIYSKRTAEASSRQAAAPEAPAPTLPGPYTANAPAPQPDSTPPPPATPPPTQQPDQPAPAPPSQPQ
ncbi:MAG TPA: energy transducer TonB [Terracidiphilus sp.]